MIFLFLLPLTFILWPFNIGVLNSQILGLFLIAIALIPKFKIVKKIKLPIFSLFWYLLFISILVLSIVFKENDSEILKFLYYSLIIPFLFIASFIYKESLDTKKDNSDIIRILYTVLPFLLFCLIEIISPDFYEFASLHVMTEAAKQTYENNSGGNQFRFLGWSGFLFADYSVALSFTALALLLFNSKVSFLSIFIELFCIVLSVIAGRSGLPIVVIYLIISLFFRFNYIRFFSILSLGIIIISYILIIFGEYFFIWLFEPIYRYIEYGTFYSASANETNMQFKDFLKDISTLNIFGGSGIYFNLNSSYNRLNIISGDSGIIRIYHATGIMGLLFFLFFWLSILLKFCLSYIKNKKYKSYKLFIIFFMVYGFIFFYKSEWLYQKFFIFTVFYFYHKIFSNTANSKYTNKRNQ